MATCGSSTGKVSAALLRHPPSLVTCTIVTRPYFTKERVTDFGIFDSKTNLAIQKMRERFDQGLAIDFQVGTSPLFHETPAPTLCSRISAADSPLIQLVNFFWGRQSIVLMIPFRGLERMTATYPPQAIGFPVPLPTLRLLFRPVVG